MQIDTILGSILYFIFTTIGDDEYAQYIKGQSLNLKNIWKAAYLNDVVIL